MKMTIIKQAMTTLIAVLAVGCGSAPSICEGNACRSALTCGNSELEIGEQCDDGNRARGDGCSESCMVEQCANHADCDDGDVCTQNICNPVDGQCITLPRICGPNDPTCAAECTVECVRDSDCADLNLCTTNRCDGSTNTCVSEAVECGIGKICSPASGVCQDEVLPLRGDCNQNGSVEAGDPICLVLCIGGTPPPTADCRIRADCNCDGYLNSADTDCTVLAQIDAEGPSRCDALPGDCDGDGELTAVDAQCIQQCLADTAPPTADCTVAADCDCDGDVESDDVTCANRRAVEAPVIDQCELVSS